MVIDFIFKQSFEIAEVIEEERIKQIIIVMDIEYLRDKE